MGTPLGEYPFSFQRVERRGYGIAVVGHVAGLESSVVLERQDLRSVAAALALAVPAAALILSAARRRRGDCSTRR